MSEYIKKPEVAKRLGMTLRTVDFWTAKGIIPYYKVARSVLFKWDEVEEHLQNTCRRLNTKEDGHINELEANDKQ